MIIILSYKRKRCVVRHYRDTHQVNAVDPLGLDGNTVRVPIPQFAPLPGSLGYELNHDVLDAISNAMHSVVDAIKNACSDEEEECDLEFVGSS